MQTFTNTAVFPKDWEKVRFDYSKILRIPDERQFHAFCQYQIMVNYAYQLGSLKNVLEIGAGFSTVLLSLLAAERKCKVYCVDVDYTRVREGVDGTELESVVNENITFLRGTSITGEQFEAFYRQGSIEEYAGIPVSKIAGEIGKFITERHDRRKLDKIIEKYSLGGSLDEVKNLLIKDNKFIFDKGIMDIYCETGDFEDEYRFFGRNDIGEKGIIDRLKKEVPSFDVIFFDCGEFSSNVEYLLLKDNIRPGGLAVFHDIYFPKSYKNFLVCASVILDNDFEVLYVDESTPQGLMIAVRK